MRFLNKIYLINSAHVPLAEIKLDGNVHFTGNQGVGKSTLLRVLLFFYNADKGKLGISREKSGFDDFYLPYSNSYIIYEVMRENGAYSIIVSRASGRASYRFVDSEFHTEWIVDPQTRKAVTDWSDISQHLKGISYSRKIDTAIDYKNIIFGNARHLGNEFAKYAILESSKYQNIPQSIQNVFLNSMLDADFIKKSLIQSLTTIAEPIKLEACRKQVGEFEQEFTDIEKWYKKEPNGRIVVRDNAEQVVKTFRLLIAYRNEIEVLFKKLNYAVRIANQKLPDIKAKQTKLQELIIDLSAEIKNTRAKYDSQKESLNKELGKIEGKLEEINNKKKNYEARNITEIIKRFEKEEIIKTQKSNVETKRNELLDKNSSIDEKFQKLIDEIKNNQEYFVQKKRNSCNNKQLEFLSFKEVAQNTKNTALEKTNDIFSEDLKNYELAISNFTIEKTKLEVQLEQVKNMHPKQKEIEDCKVEKQAMQFRETELSILKKSNKDKFDNITNAGNLEKSEIDKKYQTEISSTNALIEKITAEISKLDSLLNRYEGSFCMWLDNNVSDWQNTVGKVVDVERVLYSTELNPRLSNGNSIFGIEIDLDNVAPSEITYQQNKELRSKKADELQDIQSKLNGLLLKQESEKQEVVKKYNKKLNDLKQEALQIDLEQKQLPAKLENISNKIFALTAEEEEIRDAKRKEINEKIVEISIKINTEISNKKECEAKLKVEKDRIINDCNQKIKEKEDETKAFIDSAKKEVEEKQRVDNEEIEKLNQQKTLELKGAGVNTEILNQYEKQIQDFGKELKYIDSVRNYVAGYRNDCTELFDKEPLYISDKNKLATQISNLGKEFTEKWNSQNRELKANEQEFSRLQQEEKQLSENVIEANFIFQSPEYKQDLGEMESLEDIRQIINELRSKMSLTNQNFSKLKNHINSFKSQFSANNTFHFKTDLFSDEDFEEFAVELNSFVSNDAIEQYRGRTSKLYADILHFLSKEISSLTKYNSDIQYIINEIDNDFKNKKFAGVIKSIEIRKTDSDDKLMQLLMEINKFTQENSFSIDEINLFSASTPSEKVNAKVVDYLRSFIRYINENPNREELTLFDTFELEFRIVENDNDTKWIKKLSNVGSDGTDILVKAMVNIMLISVFKQRASKKFGDFQLHCMMDEIGKLHPSNIKGLLDFANMRNILLINSSPVSTNGSYYKYTYSLSKDEKSNTHVNQILSRHKK